MLMAIPEAPENSGPGLSPNSTSTAGSYEGGAGIMMMGGKPLPGKDGGTGSPINSITQTGQSQRIIPSKTLHSKHHEIRGDPEQSNPMLLRRVYSTNENNGGPPMNGIQSEFQMMDPVMQDQDFQQQLIQLKQEQEMQHQLLLQSYQAQRQKLAEVHEKQLQQRLKEFWENKRRQDEERDKLEQLKNKDKHEQSAIASSEVKQKLAGFLLNKKQREAAAVASGLGSVTSISPAIPTPNSIKGPLGVPGAFPSHPYRRPLGIGGKYEDDFPLRKTASEPNLLKMRLKQRVLERRNSPLVRRKESRAHLRRRSGLAMDGSGSAGSTPENSGPNSPPINIGIPGSTPHSGSGGGTPQNDDSGGSGGSPYGSSAYGPNNSASVCDLTLYSSPSLPNISLGKPIPSNPESKLAAVSETEVRCPVPPPIIASHMGIPLMPMPFYPAGTMPLPSELEALYQSGGMMALYQAQALNASQLQELGLGLDSQRMGVGRTIQRPLGRTQSAPLPLGHPMLVNPMLGMVNGVGGHIPPGINQPTTHTMLRQHIRQTVLTRAGSRGQVLGSLGRTVSVEEDSGGEAEVDENTQHLQQQQARSAYVNKVLQQHLMKHHQQQPVPESSPTGSNIPIPVPMASAIPPRLHHAARPLSRALSSPLVALRPNSPQDVLQGTGPKPGGTGLAFDSLMLKHQCLCGDNSQHPEHPGRLQSIWARLQETGLVGMCERIRTRKATLEEIQSCHSEAHTLLFGTSPLSRQRQELTRFPDLPIRSLVRLPCNGIGIDSDTPWHEVHTPAAARMAVGCVMELGFRVAAGELRNGFAIVRPPGSHSEPTQAMGFCFFNATAITAKQLRARFQLEKIMIVDWDVHHGNGIQATTYDDPHILYLSIHRHDEGNFFPGTGAPTECGVDEGLGFNINIAWSGGLSPPMGDAEYMAAFRTIVKPIAQDFQPDIILVACGFDAAVGHPPPLGGYRVSASCFGWMTKELTTIGNGKVVLALEGGYDLPAICDSAQECVRALLGEPVTPVAEEERMRRPNDNAIDTLLRVVAIQTTHWPVLKRFMSLATCSQAEAAIDGKLLMRESRVDSETVSAMASLSFSHHARRSGATSTSNDSENETSTPVSAKTKTRRSSDINMTEDTMSREEPMDQDEEK